MVRVTDPPKSRAFCQGRVSEGSLGWRSNAGALRGVGITREGEQREAALFQFELNRAFLS